MFVYWVRKSARSSRVPIRSLFPWLHSVALFTSSPSSLLLLSFLPSVSSFPFFFLHHRFSNDKFRCALHTREKLVLLYSRDYTVGSSEGDTTCCRIEFSVRTTKKTLIKIHYVWSIERMSMVQRPHPSPGVDPHHNTQIIRIPLLMCSAFGRCGWFFAILLPSGLAQRPRRPAHPRRGASRLSLCTPDVTSWCTTKNAMETM